MLAVLTAVVINSLQPVRTLEIAPHENGVVRYSYARDARYEYLATPRGLYRASRLRSAPLEPIAFAGEPVTTIAAGGDSLYAAVGLANHAHWRPHTLLRSRDRGASFTAIDSGIVDCSLEPWGEPCSPLVTRQIEIAAGRIFIEAGGNVLASGDDGITWTRLFPSRGGKPEAQMCPSVFTVIGDRVLFGGECPLDFG